MELVLLLLVAALRKRRARTFTREQLDEIERDRADWDMRLGLAPTLSAPRKPYRWWKYSGLC